MLAAVRIIDQFSKLADVDFSNFSGGGLLWWDAANTFAKTSAAGTSGQFARSGGTATPTWFDLFGTANTWTAGQVFSLATGAIAIGSSATLSAVTTVPISETYTDPAGTVRGVNAVVTAVATSGANANTVQGVRGVPTLSSTNTQNWTAGVGFRGVVGVVDLTSNQASPITVTGGAGFYAGNPGALGTNVTLTTSYGVFIETQSRGATNYSIFTQGNIAHFGGTLEAGSGPTTLTDAAGKILSDALNTVAVARGGTGLTSGTSGGVLGYTASGTLASSIALTASALVLGGGAGATPTPMGSLGTTTTLLHGNAVGAPTFAAVDLAADVTGILPSANGGTANGFFAVSGPASSVKTFAFPNASATVLTTNAAVTVAQGGTGIAVGTSGGIPYFSGTTTIASSAALTTSAIVLGGGAGAAPTPMGSLGTTTTVLHGNAAGAPTFAAVDLAADMTGILPGANGGTSNGFFAVSGPATSLKTFTFPNASATVLTDNTAVTVAQGGIGVATLASNGVLYGNGTGVVQVTAQGPATSVLTANAGAPSFSATPQLTRLGLGVAADSVSPLYTKLSGVDTAIFETTGANAYLHVLAPAAVNNTCDVRFGDATTVSSSHIYALFRAQVTQISPTLKSQLEFWSNAGGSILKQWIVQPAGHFVTNLSNTLDLGAPSSEPRTVYAGTSLLATGTAGQSCGLKRKTELVSVGSGLGTKATTITLPADAIVLAVPVRVLVQPGGTTTMTVTATTSATAFQKGANISTAANTTDPGTKNCPTSYNGTAAQTVTFTFNTNTTDALGSIRIDVYYFEAVPPTS